MVCKRILNYWDFDTSFCWPIVKFVLQVDLATIQFYPISFESGKYFICLKISLLFLRNSYPIFHIIKCPIRLIEISRLHVFFFWCNLKNLSILKEN